MPDTTFNGVTSQIPVYYYTKGTGTSANEVVNTPTKRPDTFNTFEVGLTKRYSKRYNGFVAYWMTKSHRWLQGTEGITGSPNDDRFPIDNTWAWEARAAGTYFLPKGFQLSGFFRAASGTPGQRVSVFTNTALSQGSTTLRMGPFGEFRGPVVPLLNIKGAKVFKIHDRFKIEANAQLFNVTNSSAFCLAEISDRRQDLRHRVQRPLAACASSGRQLQLLTGGRSNHRYLQRVLDFFPVCIRDLTLGKPQEWLAYWIIANNFRVCWVRVQPRP